MNLNRSRAVDRLRARILRHGTPRLQMGLIVTITGLAGFLSSVALLRTGVTSMAMRYPLAATIAYLVFLAQLRIWLSFDRHRAEPRTDVDDLDASEFSVQEHRTPESSPGHDARAPVASHEAPDAHTDDVPHAGVLGEIDFDDEALLGALPESDFDDEAFLVPLGVALAGVVAAVYVVCSAPALFSELALDAAIVSRVYRRFRYSAPEGWLAITFRRTRAPLIALVFTLAVIGLAADRISPGAHSVGDLLRSGAQRLVVDREDVQR